MKRLIAYILVGCLLLFSAPALAQQVTDAEMTLDFYFGTRTGWYTGEVSDGLPDGSPGELTLRRLRRFAAGGAGLIWVEAVAVVETGRGNPRHLWLTEQNADAFAAMADMIRETARAAHGHDITIVIQLTHAGRYSKPYGPPLPGALSIATSILLSVRGSLNTRIASWPTSPIL
jgi:hypothetical protein